MNFSWKHFTKDQFEYMKGAAVNDYVGAVHVGDICIDLLCDSGTGKMICDFYVLHEDTGYGNTKTKQIPYDYAEGFEVDTVGVSYEDFVKNVETKAIEFIQQHKGANSLTEHAAKDLVIEDWE